MSSRPVPASDADGSPGRIGAPEGATPGRRCRPRRLDPLGPRPSDLLAMFFASALLMLVAAAVAALAHTLSPDWRLHWLALHLALLGGVSQLVLGAGQFFVCAFLATTPPSKRFAAGQVGVWNVGTLLVAVGVPLRIDPLVEVGGVLLLVGLGLFAAAIRGMERRSLQRAPWAVRWYQGSAACLVLGAVVGIVLARGVGWTHGSLLGSHLALNLAGWLGTAIVGTLHTFFPSLTGTVLRYPRLQGPTFGLWLSGVLLLAVGAAYLSDVLVTAGWVALLLAALLLTANLLGSLRASAIVLALPGRLVGVAQTFLVAGLLLALVATLVDGASAAVGGSFRAPLAVLLLAGWIGMTVSGSLLHLLAVLGRVRNFALAMPVARPLPDRLLAAVAVVGVTAWAAAHIPGWEAITTPAKVLVLAVALVLAARIVTLVVRAARPARRPHPHGRLA